MGEPVWHRLAAGRDGSHSLFLPLSFLLYSCASAVLLSYTSCSLDGKGKITISGGGALPASVKHFLVLFCFSKTTVLNPPLLALNSGDPSLCLFCETVLA